MTTFLINQTKSYVLIGSKETGEVTLDLSEELTQSLKEMQAEADTNADVVAGVLDLMGDDAAAYLAAMGELTGYGDTLVDIYAEKGIAGLMDEIAELKGDPLEGANDFVSRANAGNGFDNFKDVSGSNLSSITGYGQPSGDPFAEDGSDEGKAAVEAAASDDGLMLGAAAAWGVGIGLTLVVVAILVVANDASERDTNHKSFIPADPNEPGFNFAEWLERPWAEESLDSTFGETMPSGPDADPYEGHLVDGHTKEYNPEDELAREVLTDQDRVQDAITAAEVEEAAIAAVDHRIIPLTPEVDTGDLPFNFGFGDEAPDVNGGEDFGHDGLMATATEYIVSERDGDLSLTDTMIFNSSVQAGEVEVVGTSDGMLSAALNEVEQGIYTADMG